MSAIASRRRRRALTAVALGVAGLLALPSGLVLGANRLLNESGGDNVDNRPTTRIPTTPTALLAVVNDRGQVASMAMLAVAPSGRGGSIVSIPVGANAEIPKTGTIHRVADSYTGAPDPAAALAALRADVEGLLNVSFSTADDMTATELATVLAPVGEREVTLPSPVMDTRADGTVVEVAPAGPSTLAPDRIAAALAASQDGVAETSRLPNVRELWSAVAAAGTAPTSTDTTVAADDEATEPADIAAYYSALLAGPVQVWQLSATLVTDAVRNPGNVDLYDLDGGEVIMVMASIAPSAIALVSNSLALMIDTPYDDSSLVREAVLRLAYAGANVVVVRTVTAAPEQETRVFFNDPVVRNDLGQYVTLMGELSYQLTDEVIEGVNARIVLGENFREFVGSPAGRTIVTTTSSSTVPE
ncbi:MAG: hypothetical protein ACO36A_07685 [Ilumatobacteraceae bacterium]